LTTSYEDKCNAEGKPQSHEEAKEIMAGITGSIVDRVCPCSQISLRLPDEVASA